MRVGVCPGEFNDYARDGRDLIVALRERNAFREVGPVGMLSAPADVVLAPDLGEVRPRPTLGLITLVPWIASATIFPWFVRSDREVKIRVLTPDTDSNPCARRAAAATFSTGLVTHTQVMLGWSAPLVAMLPNWEMTTNHEFRSAIDSLLARRDWLMELAGRKH